MSRRNRAEAVPQKGSADDSDSENGKEEKGQGAGARLAGANSHVLIPKVAKLSGLTPTELHSWKANFVTSMGGDASEQRPFLWIEERVKPAFKLAVSTKKGVDIVPSATPLTITKDTFWNELDTTRFWLLFDLLRGTEGSERDLLRFLEAKQKVALKSALTQEEAFEDVTKLASDVLRFLSEKRVPDKVANTSKAVDLLRDTVPVEVKIELDAVIYDLSIADNIDPNTSLTANLIALTSLGQRGNTNGMEVWNTFLAQASKKEQKKRGEKPSGGGKQPGKKGGKHRESSSREGPTCFKCGKHGHKSLECRNANPTEAEQAQGAKAKEKWEAARDARERPGGKET